jgi:CheY-like chemotaxis protein
VKILVVDDVRALVMITKQVLVSQGHSVEVALSGDEALATAKSFVPELVLCDLNLDVGMSGYEVAQRLREEPALRGVYLVALTGYDGDEESGRSLAAGFDAHLTKPVAPEALAAVIESAQSGRSE